MCQKWFAKFCAGDFSLEDAQWLGGQVEIDSDQSETLIEKSQCSTMWDVTDIIKISKSIKLLVKMKRVFYFMEKNLNGLFGQPNILPMIVHFLFALFIQSLLFHTKSPFSL